MEILINVFAGLGLFSLMAVIYICNTPIEAEEVNKLTMEELKWNMKYHNAKYEIYYEERIKRGPLKDDERERGVRDE